MTTASTAKKKNKEQEKPKLTKRQKIKNLQKSDLNRWPQQPNIKSPSARAKAYIRAANLHKRDDEDDKNKKNTNMIDPKLDLDAPEVKFGRLVGSTDASKRHGAIRKLELYLKERSKVENEGLCELDLMKMWKGLWHCLYMADKVPVQDELSQRLSELIWCVSGTKEEDQYAAQYYLEMDAEEGDSEDCEEEEEDLQSDNDEMEDNGDVTMKEVKRKGKICSVDDDDDDNDDVGSDGESSSSTKSSDVNDDEEEEDEDEEEDDTLIKHCRGAHLVSLMLRTFFKTVCREWGKMDKYRVDKFYTLIRLMMHQIYKYMAVRGWHLGIVRLFNDVVYEEVLGGELPNNGIRLHLIDLSLEEVAAVEREVGGVTTRIFLDVMEPFWNMCQAEEDQVVRERVMESVVVRFLERFSVVNTENTDEDPKFERVKVGDVADFLFELASDEDTIDKYRESLYGSHKNFLKRLKEVGHDAVDESIEEALKCAPSSTTTEEENTTQVVLENEVVEEEALNTTQKEFENKNSEGSTNMTDNTSSSEKKKHKKKKKKKGSTEHETTSAADNKSTHGEPNKEQEKVQKDPITDNLTKQNKSECDANTTESSSTKKNKQKKKKKKHDNKTPSKTDDNHDDTQPPAQNNDNKDTTNDDNETKPLKSNKKKKKKKDNDDVITITSKEQTQAATIMQQMETTSTTTTPPKTKKIIHVIQEDNDDHDNTTTATNTITTPTAKKEGITGDRSSRRVSFGRVNQAKSHQNSMRDLKTMEHPSTKKRTPDKSILLKRERARGNDDAGVGGGGDADDTATKKKRKKTTTTLAITEERESVKKNKKAKKKKSKK